jgi:hypothetical protein
MVNIPNSDDHLLADNKILRAELGVSLLQKLQLRRQLESHRQELRSQVAGVRRARHAAAVMIAN